MSGHLTLSGSKTSDFRTYRFDRSAEVEHLTMAVLSWCLLPSMLVAASTVHRHLQTPYYTHADLGVPNRMAAIGNPLKGLIGSSIWTTPPLDETIPLSMEWYNLGVRRRAPSSSPVSHTLTYPAFP